MVTPSTPNASVPVPVEAPSTAISPFVFEGRAVRVVGEPESPRWVADDVCAVLGVDTSESVARLDADEEGTDIIGTSGGEQRMLTVTDPSLYALLARSRKPEARRFDRWVRHDVLSAIRRTGSYSVAPRPDEKGTRSTGTPGGLQPPRPRAQRRPGCPWAGRAAPRRSWGQPVRLAARPGWFPQAEVLGYRT